MARAVLVGLPYPLAVTVARLVLFEESKTQLEIFLLIFFLPYYHTGQCKSTGGCYNELVVAYFGTGGGVKWRKR